MTKKLLFLSVMALFVSCNDINNTNQSGELVDLIVGSSTCTINNHCAFWTRDKDDVVWNVFDHKIDGFHFEEGYEYNITLLKDIDSYKLVCINSMEKKNSVLPLFNHPAMHTEEYEQAPSYYNSDSVFIFQGDELLTRHQAEELLHGVTRSIITDNVSGHHYWPNSTVYYQFDTYFPYTTYVLQAMQDIENNAGLCFVQGTGNGNYLLFTDGGSNYSYIGMTGGCQEISISNPIHGSIIHEICHALGIHHEQCRSDRNNYIIINWDNITSSYTHNFSFKQNSFDYGQFDFSSVMLYGSYAFSRNGLPTMTTINGSTFEGQRIGLSLGDIAAVRSIYGKYYFSLEYETYDTYVYQDAMEDSHEYDMVCTLKVYGNKRHTIPVNLNESMTITVDEIHETFSNGDTQIQTEVTPRTIYLSSGSNSYLIGQEHCISYYYRGEPVNLDLYSYSLR